MTGRKVPLILWDARINEVGERHMDGRHGIRVGGIDEADHLRVRVGQVDGQESPRLVTVARMWMSVIPWPSSSRMASPWYTPSFQVWTQARAWRSALSRSPHGFGQRLLAIFVDEAQEAPFAEPGRADHGAQVAQEVARMAHIGG